MKLSFLNLYVIFIEKTPKRALQSEDTDSKARIFEPDEAVSTTIINNKPLRDGI